MFKKSEVKKLTKIKYELLQKKEDGEKFYLKEFEHYISNNHIKLVSPPYEERNGLTIIGSFNTYYPATVYDFGLFGVIVYGQGSFDVLNSVI